MSPQKKYHYVLIKFVGPNCPLVKSYVSNSHKAIIKQHIPVTIELDVAKKSDITAERFQKLLKHYRLANEMTYFQYTFWNLDGTSGEKSTVASSSTTELDRDAVDDEDDDFFPSEGYFP